MSNHYLLLYALVSLDSCIAEIENHIRDKRFDDLHEGELDSTLELRRDLITIYNKYAEERDHKEYDLGEDDIE